MEQLVRSLVILIAILAGFFIASALIMVTYNNSIVKMNSSWKTINYTDAMVFTLFLTFTGAVLCPVSITTNNNFDF